MCKDCVLMCSHVCLCDLLVLVKTHRSHVLSSSSHGSCSITLSVIKYFSTSVVQVNGKPPTHKHTHTHTHTHSDGLDETLYLAN